MRSPSVTPHTTLNQLTSITEIWYELYPSPALVLLISCSW
jgi:hypothetical protein